MPMTGRLAPERSALMAPCSAQTPTAVMTTGGSRQRPSSGHLQLSHLGAVSRGSCTIFHATCHSRYAFWAPSQWSANDTRQLSNNGRASEEASDSEKLRQRFGDTARLSEVTSRISRRCGIVLLSSSLWLARVAVTITLGAIITVPLHKPPVDFA